MKNLILALTLVSLTACTKNVGGEPCIGVVDKEKPGIEYEVSLWNGAIAFIFSETIIIPIYTVAKQIKCPVERPK